MVSVADDRYVTDRVTRGYWCRDGPWVVDRAIPSTIDWIWADNVFDAVGLVDGEPYPADGIQMRRRCSEDWAGPRDGIVP